MRLMRRYQRRVCALFFLGSIVLLLSYGFSDSKDIINNNDISTQLKNIYGLREGIETALNNGKQSFVLSSGVRVTLSINTKLQKEVIKIFDNFRIPVGAYVGVDPDTGKILSLAGCELGKGLTISPALSAQYPAASLVKIVTATAALEKLKFSPATKISYRSRIDQVTRMDLKTPESRRYPRMSLTDAMAKSANNVFGKLAGKYIGRSTLESYFQKFLFSKSIPFDFPVEKSTVVLPEKDFALARTGAGFGKVFISPLHAAMITSAIAHDGIMMRPYLVESITDGRGNLLYKAERKILGRIIQKSTARKILRMMKNTPRRGTLRKTFSRRKWRYFVKKFDLAGKTGSITWGPPKRHYEWVVGVASAGDPSISFASMTGNVDLWYVKSTYVAREALGEFFNLEKEYKNRKKIDRKRKRKKS